MKTYFKVLINYTKLLVRPQRSLSPAGTAHTWLAWGTMTCTDRFSALCSFSQQFWAILGHDSWARKAFTAPQLAPRMEKLLKIEVFHFYLHILQQQTAWEWGSAHCQASSSTAFFPHHREIRINHTFSSWIYTFKFLKFAAYWGDSRRASQEPWELCFDHCSDSSESGTEQQLPLL